MFEAIKRKAYATWDGIKAWFHRSESVFMARMTAFGGFMVAALEGMDWPSLMNLDFSHIVQNTQALIAGGFIFLHGVISELARRRNDPMFQK